MLGLPMVANGLDMASGDSQKEKSCRLWETTMVVEELTLSYCLFTVVEAIVGLQWKKLLEGDQKTVDNSTMHLNKEGACLYWWLKAFLLLFTVEVDGVANLEVERLHWCC